MSAKISPERPKVNYWTNDNPDHKRMYMSLGLSELANNKNAIYTEMDI